MKEMDAKEAKEPGYYCWLPSCFLGDRRPCNWTIVSWHPMDDRRVNNGTLVGPIQPPPEKE